MAGPYSLTYLTPTVDLWTLSSPQYARGFSQRVIFAVRGVDQRMQNSLAIMRVGH